MRESAFDDSRGSGVLYPPVPGRESPSPYSSDHMGKLGIPDLSGDFAENWLFAQKVSN